MKILKYINIQVGKLGDALCVTEPNQQSQLGPVLPKSSVFDNAAIVTVLIDLAVVSQEPIYCFHHSPVGCFRACLVLCGVSNPALLIEPAN
jgi:hypothetical protein